MFTKIEVLKHMTWTALCAVAAYISAKMFAHDIMGLEKFLVYAKSAWVDTPWWVGAIFMVVNVSFLASEYRKVLKRPEKLDISFGGFGKTDRDGNLEGMQIDRIDVVVPPDKDKN